MALKSTVAGGLMLAALTGVATADTLTDQVESLPPTLEDVRILGTWEADDGPGTYRVIVTRDHSDVLTARLFVQWISYGADGARVDQSMEVVELADLGLDVVDFNGESDPDGLSLYLETFDPAAAIDETYELHVFTPTEYIFGPATN